MKRTKIYRPGLLEPENCQRCGKPLTEHSKVWLELNCLTGKYSPPGSVPGGESQGLFPFGKDCAAILIRAGRENEN
jgi:hypothetical protein